MTDPLINGYSWAHARMPRRNTAGFADAWRARYPGRPVPHDMEVYEVSEYGRAPTDEDFERLLGG